MNDTIESILLLGWVAFCCFIVFLWKKYQETQAERDLYKEKWKQEKEDRISKGNDIQIYESKIEKLEFENETLEMEIESLKYAISEQDK